MTFKEDILREAEHLAVTKKQRVFHVATKGTGASLDLRGRKVTDFASWDYLDLRFNRSVIRTLQEAIERDGLGPVSPRLVSGSSAHHVIFEESAAKFFGFKRSMLFTSRNQAVLSIITSICFERDLVFYSDEGTLPVPDAAELVGCGCFPFHSSSIDSLDVALREAEPDARKVVFVESVCPTTGQPAPLEIIIGLCQKYGALLIVDESFALGAFGLRGSGYSELLLERGAIDGIIADLSYGLGGFGCVIAGTVELCTVLSARSRTFSREPATPSFLCEINQTLLDICEKAGTDRQRLKFSSHALREKLSAIGFLGISGIDSPILCLRFSSSKEAVQVVNGLFERGFHVEHFVIPSANGLKGVVRLLLSTRHSDAEVATLTRQLSEVLTRISKK